MAVIDIYTISITRSAKYVHLCTRTKRAAERNRKRERRDKSKHMIGDRREREKAVYMLISIIE